MNNIKYFFSYKSFIRFQTRRIRGGWPTQLSTAEGRRSAGGGRGGEGEEMGRRRKRRRSISIVSCTQRISMTIGQTNFYEFCRTSPPNVKLRSTADYADQNKVKDLPLQ